MNFRSKKPQLRLEKIFKQPKYTRNTSSKIRNFSYRDPMKFAKSTNRVKIDINNYDPL